MKGTAENTIKLGTNLELKLNMAYEKNRSL
jgi:hypothetical protein